MNMQNKRREHLVRAQQLAPKPQVFHRAFSGTLNREFVCMYSSEETKYLTSQPHWHTNLPRITWCVHFSDYVKVVSKEGTKEERLKKHVYRRNPWKPQHNEWMWFP